jgi:hypothetical protein
VRGWKRGGERRGGESREVEGEESSSQVVELVVGEEFHQNEAF